MSQCSLTEYCAIPKLKHVKNIVKYKPHGKYIIVCRRMCMYVCMNICTCSLKCHKNKLC